MKDLLSLLNSKKTEFEEEEVGFLSHFHFLKMGEIQRGGQILTENDFIGEKTFHFRISGSNKQKSTGRLTVFHPSSETSFVFIRKVFLNTLIYVMLYFLREFR